MVFGKGDRKAQQQRRRKYNKNIPSLPKKYMLIDGNYSNKPVAYCCRYHGYLTNNQMHLHKCVNRKCNKCKSLEWQFSREGDI